MQENNQNYEISSLYKLASGENLESVSKKFQIPMVQIKNANQKIAIKEGVTIAIPYFSGEKYTVKIGDTIESICQKFNVDEKKFVEKNGVNYVYCNMIVWI